MSDTPDAVPPPDRTAWPVRRLRLGDEPPDDLARSTTAEQRLEMMWSLALEAWALAGRPLPDYPRAAAPVSVTRPAAPGSS